MKTFEQLKSAAHLLYDQYLSEKSNLKLIPDNLIIRSLYVRMNTEAPKENWFDDVIQYLYNTLQVKTRLFHHPVDFPLLPKHFSV